ncbi:MAG: VanZ family protein [Muribaculaceae bacterium]|nr:VanZ family protein [Muribaculaceae bacterium]
MERVRSFLSGLPPWLFSTLTIIAILWLTLAPKPLGEKPPPLFPGADKIAHGIMFGGLTAMLLLDWQRKHDWKPTINSRIWIDALSCGMFGILIEYLQDFLQMGRGFEYADMIADCAGALIIGLFWTCCQRSWTRR